MNAFDVGTLAEAMEAEGVFQIRFWRSARIFTVRMDDGRVGQGDTLRQAIKRAGHMPEPIMESVAREP